jgi:hypothetical protein
METYIIAQPSNVGGEGDPVSSAAALTLISGRYDSASRSISNGTAGAVAITAAGHVRTGSEAVADTGTYSPGTSIASLVGVVRKDAMTALAGTDGDISALQVDASGSLRVTGGGGGTQYTAGTDTFAEATSVVTAAGVVRKDATGTLVDGTNELTALQVDNRGVLRIQQEAYKPFELTTNLAATTLNNNGSLAQGATGIITLASSAGFTAADANNYIRIENEIIKYDLTGASTNEINVLARAQFGTTAVAHTEPVNVGKLYDSGIQTLDTYTQVITKIQSDQNCAMKFIWYSDAGGTVTVRSLTQSYSSANGYDFLSAPAFAPYVRYTIAPSTSTTTGEMYFTTSSQGSPSTRSYLHLTPASSGQWSRS